MNRITIDPITRLEGHGKIEIFLDDKGQVSQSYLQVPELRGFEKFCEGRKAEDMPQLTSRICGVCPVAHHYAATKALDIAFGAEPTETAKKLRELTYCGYIIYDHILHFYFLAAPDFIVGPDAPKEKRNIIGIIEKVGLELAGEVIKHRAYGQKITEILGGKPTHPVCGIPGGTTKSISKEERDQIEKMAQSCRDFALKSLDIFHKVVLEKPLYMSLITNPAFSLNVYNMGTVDQNNKVNFYDGMIRVTDPSGQEFIKFKAEDYLKHLGEEVVEWSYVKIPYLKQVGFKGLTDGIDSGLYRVGPLGRLNAADGMATPKAQQEYEVMYKTIKTKPVTSTLAFHWARLIELLYASERALELIKDPQITDTNIRNMNFKNQSTGIGVVEAARGTLFHHYELTDDRLIKKVNMIVATTNNNGVINMSIRNAARELIKSNAGQAEWNEGILNTIEMFFRAYDPCFGCASHSFGILKLEIDIFDKQRKLIQSIKSY
jgi:F420-non-reducing hydrogenase large subunit